ncbi:MAG: DNA gyrase inhibitor YacG [Kordiimonas sp.]|nr:DNA gyrase inhibitor YacG [Kordiimonas sp.]
MTASSPSARPQKGICPICKKHLSEQKYRPFCSARCADVDLHHWLKESYSLPGEPANPFPTQEEE